MRNMEFFRQVPQADVPWRGRSLCMPAFYYDAMSIEADFLAPIKQVEAYLPSKRLRPYRITPWHCVVTIVSLMYRDSYVGPYNEVLIAVPVTLDKPSHLFTGLMHPLPEAPMVYILHLPVTTEIARDAGIDFLSAPKFIANIDFEERDGWVSCRLLEGNEHILTLSVKSSTMKSTARSYQHLITQREGYLLRSEVMVCERSQSVSRNSSDARLKLGTHPISRELKQMNLGRAFMCNDSPQYQLILTPILESLPI